MQGLRPRATQAYSTYVEDPDRSVEDTVVLILTMDADALDALRQTGVKLGDIDTRDLDERSARRLSKRLEQRSRRRQTAVGEAYIDMFQLLGVRVECPRGILAKIAEINSVRNCVLHRAGVIDEQAIMGASALKPFLGRKLPITSKRYQQYYSAVAEFCKALLSAVLASSYIWVQLLHPEPPRQGSTIQKLKYDRLSETILSVIPAGGRGLLVEHLAGKVQKALPDSVVRRLKPLEANVAAVRDDLVARGKLELEEQESQPRLFRG